MHHDARRAGTYRLPFVLLVALGLGGCAAEMGDRAAKDEEHAEEHQWTTTASLTTTEDRYMYFEGSCHFLACCSKRNCSLPDADVVGACGTGCSDSTPWIARPDRDRRYSCGECVTVCVRGTSNCADAVVWDNSITSAGIEGNIALFDELGLAHTDNPSACSGTGGAWVTVSPCGSSPPAEPDPGDAGPAEPDPGGSDPGGSDPGGSDPGGSDPGGSDPGGSDPGADSCTCESACGYCWCGTTREGACPDTWYGTGDGCDCGCQWTDPDCSGAGTPGIPGGEPEDPGGGSATFTGVYCTDPGLGCGGNSPCWPHYDCPSGSTCDWSSGSWGRCME